MKLNHWLVVAAVTACWPGSALSQTSSQVYGQPLALELPENWIKVHDKELGGMHSLEFVPEGQTMSDWSELICLQAFQGMAERLRVVDFLDEFSLRYQEACKGEWLYEPLGELEHGAHALMGCSRIADQHSRTKNTKLFAEMGYYQVIQGTDELYLIHRSSRGADFNSLRNEYQTPANVKIQSLKLNLPVESD